MSTNAKLDHQNHNSENMAMWETACGPSQQQHRYICGLTKSYRDQREEVKSNLRLSCQQHQACFAAPSLVHRYHLSRSWRWAGPTRLPACLLHQLLNECPILCLPFPKCAMNLQQKFELLGPIISSSAVGLGLPSIKCLAISDIWSGNAGVIHALDAVRFQQYNNRRKFRNQTSDKWTDEKQRREGRVREKRRVEERRSEKRKSQKKEDPGVRKGRKVAKHCVLPRICGSRGSKSRLAKLKRRVKKPSGQMRDEKLHAVVVRSTFRSQNVQNTPAPDHFWKLRCRKSARRCGEKRICK